LLLVLRLLNWLLVSDLWVSLHIVCLNNLVLFYS
jgi:hypothetical protein